MNKPVIFSAKFHKHYLQRVVKQKKLLDKVEQKIELFCLNPRDAILRDHGLKGEKNLLRSFSDHYNFLDIGTHNQVY